MPVDDTAPSVIGWSDGLLEAGFGSPRAAAMLGWDTRIEHMCAFEAALATVQARHGLITSEAAAQVATACDPANLDLAGLALAARRAATPMIPLLDQLRALAGPEGAAAVHRGATSQDAIDTAMMLQVRDALDLLDAELVALASRCADLARAQRRTVAPGRTLQQQAVPITIGLVAARWYAALTRRIAALRHARPEVLVCQLGGVVGTLGAFGPAGPAVLDDLAEELGLWSPELPWHAERDRVVTLAGLLAGVVEVVTKVAGDVVRSSATELGELHERPTAGPGSSALPHKRNPVHAVAARAACGLASGHLQVLLTPRQHEFERSAGDWQAEWVAIPGALVTTIGAVERLQYSLAGLEVDADRARRNLDCSQGLGATETLLAALANVMGWESARAILGEVTGRIDPDHDLATVAGADPRVTTVLGADQLAAALAPESAIRAVDELIDRALRIGGARLGTPSPEPPSAAQR